MHAAAVGLDVDLGSRIRSADLDEIASVMADLVIAAVRGESAAAPLFLTEPLAVQGVDGVIFSGGVAEYIYRTETRDFGDLGRRLGLALADRTDDLPAPVLVAEQRIRATVLGASEYTVQLSGITSFIPTDAMLPRRNVQVARPAYVLGDVVEPEVVRSAIEQHLSVFGLHDAPADIALALRWNGPPSYRRLRAFAEGAIGGLRRRLADGRPVYLMVDGDVALSLGCIMRDELAVTNDLLILDGIDLRDFDFVDLGRVRHPSNTVPVTIKSLVFAAADNTAVAMA
jgi:ethanolamine utilization protein EutA